MKTLIIIIIFGIFFATFAKASDKIERKNQNYTRRISKYVGGSSKQFLDKFNQYDIDIDQQDRKGNTILLNTVKAGNVKLVEYLLSDMFADPDIENKQGERPLLIAISNNWHEIVVLLLDAGASTYDVNLNDNTLPEIKEALSEHGVW